MADTSTEQNTQAPELNPLEKAQEILKRVEEANKKAEDILKKNQEIEARRILNGRSTTSGQPEDVTPEQLQKKKAEDMAKDIVKAFK